MSSSHAWASAKVLARWVVVLRLASIQNYLPASLLLVLLGVAAVALHFLSWSFGTVGRGGRFAMVLLGLLVVAVLYMIMDVNRPQRGGFSVGVESLERVQTMMSE